MATDVRYGETRDLVFVPIDDGVAQTGESAEILIRRLSDGYSWNGAAFDNTTNWEAMTEVTDGGGGTGQYIYEFTFPSADTDYQVLYRVTALEILVSEDIYVRNVPDLGDLDAAEAAIIAEIDANEVKIDANGVAIANNLTAIQSVQNNTRFTSAVPEVMQKPDSGDEAYRHTGNLYDTDGNMEDPADNEILVRVLQDDGTPITANLYKENALTTPLADPTDTVNFPPASGWRAMERLGVGRYDYFYKVASTETEESLTIEFGWKENSAVLGQFRKTSVSDAKGDIEDIQLKVDAIYVKTDAPTPSPTIPAQIATHDSDIKALQRVDACPDLFYVPDGRTQIDVDGGITDVQTTIPVALSDNLLSAGIVKIESEYVIYTGVSGGSLTGCTRGAYSTSNVAHADDTPVSQTLMFPIMLVIRDNEGNMLAPDSPPTIEIEDWNEVQELAPTAMTLKSTGVYRYNYLIDYGTLAENKLLKFVTVIDSITAQHRHMVVIIDEPASSLDLVRYLGGGTGDFILDQDGWYDSDGIKTLWTDVAKGFIRDADTGAPLDDAYVTAYPIINGETKYSGRPTAQARTRSNGTYLMALDYNSEGYTFVIEKDGFRIVGDGVVTRTVGP